MILERFSLNPWSKPFSKAQPARTHEPPSIGSRSAAVVKTSSSKSAAAETSSQRSGHTRQYKLAHARVFSHAYGTRLSNASSADLAKFTPYLWPWEHSTNRDSYRTVKTSCITGPIWCQEACAGRFILIRFSSFFRRVYFRLFLSGIQHIGSWSKEQ